jgi:putative membrane protein
MALADSVPGVSGGTIAFIMGFYDNFISSLSNLVHGSRKERIEAVRFLAKLAIGWIVGMAMAVTVLASVFTSGIYQVSSLFLGFVAVSIPMVIMEERKSFDSMALHMPFVLLGLQS